MRLNIRRAITQSMVVIIDKGEINMLSELFLTAIEKSIEPIIKEALKQLIPELLSAVEEFLDAKLDHSPEPVKEISQIDNSTNGGSE